MTAASCSAPAATATTPDSASLGTVPSLARPVPQATTLPLASSATEDRQPAATCE